MRTAALLFAVGAACLARPARADDRPLTEALSVASADECLTSTSLAEHLAVWLGADVIDERIVIVVETGDGRAAFEILASGEPLGSRRFDRLPADCADRRAVVSLAISLTLDDQILEALTSPVGADASTGTRPEASPEPAGPTPGAPATPGAPGVALEVEAAALVGLLFDPVLLGAVDVRILLPEGVSLRLGALVSGMAGGALGAARVEVALVGGRASVCLGRVVTPPVVLEGCLGAWAGAVHAAGRGFAVDRAVDLGLVAPAARVEVRIEPLPWLALFAAVEGVVSVLRPRVLVEGAGASRDLGDVGLTLGGGGALVLR